MSTSTALPGAAAMLAELVNTAPDTSAKINRAVRDRRALEGKKVLMLMLLSVVEWRVDHRQLTPAANDAQLPCAQHLAELACRNRHRPGLTDACLSGRRQRISE